MIWAWLANKALPRGRVRFGAETDILMHYRMGVERYACPCGGCLGASLSQHPPWANIILIRLVKGDVT